MVCIKSEKNYHVSANLTFCFKSLVNDFPLAFSLLFVFSFILFLAIQCRIYERPYQDQNCITNGSCLNFGHLQNAIWCTIITMTSGKIEVVGYGDFSPSTLGGRVAECTAAILGSFVLTCMVVSLATGIKLDPNQQKVSSFRDIINLI